MAWFKKTNRTPPPQRGQVGNHDVEVHSTGRGRHKVHVDGARYVRDDIRFRDFSKGEKATLLGAYGVNAGTTGLAAYGLRNLGEFADSWIMSWAAGLGGAKSLVEKVFTGNERAAIKNLEDLMQKGVIDSGSYNTAEQYLTNFAGYKTTSGLIDQARAGIEQSMAQAARAAGNITPQLPTDSLYEKLHELILGMRGINATDPRYAENNLKVLQLRKDVYDTLDDAARIVTSEIGKSNPNVGYGIEQMARFNKAYEMLLSEEAQIKAGVEKANPAQLIAIQQQIDQIKPTGFDPYIGVFLPILGGAVVWKKINKMIVSPVKTYLSNR